MPSTLIGLSLTALLLLCAPGATAAMPLHTISPDIPVVGTEQTAGGAAPVASVTVSGSVVDEQRAVVPGATIEVRGPDGALLAATSSGPNGSFAVQVPPGRHVVSASLEGFSLAQADVVADRRDISSLVLILRPGHVAEHLLVAASRLVGSHEMLRQTPGSFALLTHADLTSSRVFTTSEALRKIPGLTVRDEEGLGLRPNIGIRGLNPTRSSKVLLLEDGVPTAFAPYGDNASYYHPPIERFERIEVLKGASQLAHGPVTLGGVINYITPEAPVRPSLAIGLTGGTRDLLNGSLSGGGTWARTGIFAQATSKQSSGARDNTHSQLADAMAKLTRPLGGTRRLDLKANYYSEDSQVTYSGLREDEYVAAPRQNPFADDRFDGRRRGLAATYRSLVGTRVALAATAYASDFSRDWWRQSSNSAQRPNDAADPLCGSMANLETTCGNEGRLRDYQQGGAELRARVAFAAGVAQETDLGVRAHAERQDRRQLNGAFPWARTGTLVEDNLRTTDAYSAFVQHRLLMGRWTLTPGTRIERVSYYRRNRLLDAAGATRLTEVVPGVGLSWGPSSQTTLFAGVHKGFAPPRAEDVISNATGGTIDLEPERSWNYELGARTRVLRVVDVDVALFRLDYQNQIVPASLAGGLGAALTNGGQTLQQGFEAGFDANWRGLRDTRHDIYAKAAFTWVPTARFTGTRTSNVVGFSAVSVSGNRLPYAPRTLLSATIGYRHAGGLDMQLERQHVGDQFTDDLNTKPGSADGQRGLIAAYAYWNAAVSYGLPRSTGTFFVAIKNLGNRTFIVDRSRGILPSHPRLVQVGTTWRF